MNRRDFLTAAAGAIGTVSLGGAAIAQPRPPARKRRSANIPDDVVWHDVRDWGVEGRAFDDVESYFDRLPARAKDVVRDAVWRLSHDSAGMSVRFEADTQAIYLRYALTNHELAMAHMPATGVSGVDLYALDEKRWRYVATHLPAEQESTTILCESMVGGRRKYLAHLPLYNGVKSLEIGLPAPEDKSFAPIKPRKEKPILFYGTSITQGGCASRPGMAFTNILARRLDRPVLNFGFSGNGKMELEVAQFLAEIDAGVFIIDCSGNMAAADDIDKRCSPLIKLLRDKRGAAMPILLADERPEPVSWLKPQVKKVHDEKTAALKRAYDARVAAGDGHIYYCPGDNVIGTDGEATVDGSHPTDLGMMRYTDVLEASLRNILT